ncbi:MAG: histidine phosphatase family protein [Turicibacter sp.]|nr:histidine phosphatase family protein [Turicibacter sp.]
MTTIYFIRHAEPNRTVGVDATYPLTEKGLADCVLVSHFLRGRGIEIALSSPFKRAVDTIKPFADGAGLAIELVEDFRERAITDHWIADFDDFSARQWADFSYKLPDGECLSEVQARNLAALGAMLRKYEGKTWVVGTHGTALSTIIHHYDEAFGLADFREMTMPWAVKMCFDGEKFLSWEKIDLFAVAEWVTECRPLNGFSDLGKHEYSVIFAHEADGKRTDWLYVRHRDRQTFEMPGGHIEDWESPAIAAKRELFEETGATEFFLTPAFEYITHTGKVYGTGQVFLAEIYERGAIPEESEIAEVAAFDGLPPQMTYPQILPVLFAEMQAFLAKNTADEYYDLMDENRQPLGKMLRRGSPKPAGAFHLVVRSWVVNSRGECLITQRSFEKYGWPGMWEVPSGSVVAGEDSRTAAVRELREESGIIATDSGFVFCENRNRSAIFDNWVFFQEFDLADVVLQEGETIAARAATLDEILEMAENGEFIEFVREEIETLRERMAD